MCGDGPRIQFSAQPHDATADEQQEVPVVGDQRRERGQEVMPACPDRAALATLRTLMLNGGWERYWQQREVLRLVAT